MVLKDVLGRTLDTAMTELVELRKERTDLLRALAEARDRGDTLVNALLTAKGGTPVPFSPRPSPASLDPFEEDATIAEEIRTMIRTHGVEASFVREE